MDRTVLNTHRKNKQVLGKYFGHLTFKMVKGKAYELSNRQW